MNIFFNILQARITNGNADCRVVISCSSCNFEEFFDIWRHEVETFTLLCRQKFLHYQLHSPGTDSFSSKCFTIVLPRLYYDCHHQWQSLIPPPIPFRGIPFETSQPFFHGCRIKPIQWCMLVGIFLTFIFICWKNKWKYIESEITNAWFTLVTQTQTQVMYACSVCFFELKNKTEHAYNTCVCVCVTSVNQA